MKYLNATAVGTACALCSGVSIAQTGHMMNGGGMWGGWIGGYWGPVLLAVVVGVIVWAILQKRK